MERWNAFRTKYGVRVIVLILSMLFLCSFIQRKEGFHMDEILTFELANAEYNPWIVPTQPVGRLAKFMQEYIKGDSLSETVSNGLFIVRDTISNRGSSILANYKADVYENPVWMSRQMFQDYVQCGDGDDYNLFSVYFNVKDDNHPPVHFMLVHLISSLFKGDISAWKGCVINLIAAAGTLWLMGLIGDMLYQKKSSTVTALILYGFSTGILGTTLLIRMYGLLTLWTVWILYLHLRKFLNAGGDSFVRISKKKGKAAFFGCKDLAAVTVLSFWTQYFGLFFILPLALVTVVLLYKRGRRAEMWSYIRSMVLAGVIGVCLYPFAIGDVLFSSRGTEALSQWGNGIGEYFHRLLAFWQVLSENVAGNGILLGIVLLCPCLGAWYLKKRRKSREAKPELWLMTGIPLLCYFLLAARMSPYFVDRYIMAIFPITVLFMMGLWDRCSDLFPARKQYPGICLVLVCLMLFVGQGAGIKKEHTYLYTGYQAQLAVSEEYAGYPLVCLYPGYSFYENVMEMERYRETILLKEEELFQVTGEQRTETEEGYVALIKYPGEESGREQLEAIMEVFGGKQATLLYEGGAYGDAIYLVLP